MEPRTFFARALLSSYIELTFSAYSVPYHYVLTFKMSQKIKKSNNIIRLSTTYHGASLCLLLGPVPAVRKALAKAGWSVDEVDLFELNEAFAAQAIAVVRYKRGCQDLFIYEVIPHGPETASQGTSAPGCVSL